MNSKVYGSLRICSENIVLATRFCNLCGRRRGERPQAEQHEGNNERHAQQEAEGNDWELFVIVSTGLILLIVCVVVLRVMGGRRFPVP